MRYWLSELLIRNLLNVNVFCAFLCCKQWIKSLPESENSQNWHSRFLCVIRKIVSEMTKSHIYHNLRLCSISQSVCIFGHFYDLAYPARLLEHMFNKCVQSSTCIWPLCVCCQMITLLVTTYVQLLIPVTQPVHYALTASCCRSSSII